MRNRKYMDNHAVLRKAAAIFMAAGLVLAGCSAQPAANTDAPVERETPVQTAAVEFGVYYQEHEIVGSAMANASVDVYPRMNGDLVRVYVQKGDRVSVGDVLGSLRDEDLRTQLELERSALELAQLQYKQLVQSGMASDSDLEQARLNVEQHKLRVNQAEQQLRYTALETPISGEVVQVNAREGQFVTASYPLFQVVELDPIKLVAHVSAGQLLMLQRMEQVEVVFPDLGKTATASISYLSPVTNELGFYTLEAELPNESHEIKPGMIAKFIVNQELQHNVLMVPTESIVERDGETVIFIVKDGRAVRKKVEILQSGTDLSAIAGDAAAGDQVVIRGQNTIDDGFKVRIVEGAQ